jgi:beta-exotoxin I transport system permease protein
MFANVFTKSTRDRLGGGVLGALVIGIFVLFALWVYKDVDLSFYYDLPIGILQLMGIDPQGGGVGSMAYGAMYNFIGAIVVAGIALSIGASAIAGEEQDGTFGLLLGNPLSRRGAMVAKGGALVLIVGVMGLLLYATGVWSAQIVSVETTGLHLGAISFAIALNGLFYGLLALAVGAWTGKRGLASGVAAASMIIGYLAAGLLPLADLDGLAKIFPWHYYSAGEPLNNGLDGGDVAVLVGLCLVCCLVAWVGIQRRDLRDRGTDVTLLDRLRANPRTAKLMERVAGSARVSRISVKTASDFQGLLTVTTAIMFYMGVLIPPLYNLLPEDFVNIFASFPDAMVAMIGGIDMSTAAGFITGEVFSLVGPIAIIVLLASMGSRALAGEEEAHTMGLLMSNPLPRSRVVMEKTLAMTGHAVLFGLVTAFATWVGVLISGLDEVSIEGIVAVSIQLVLFGLVFGAVSLAVGAAFGRRRLANTVTTGVALLSWFMFSFLTLSDRTDFLASFSPFEWYLGGDPLLDGMDWSGAGLLLLTFLVLVAVSMPLFNRRDLRG